MFQARVQAVSGRQVLANGKWLTTIGNTNVQIGDLIWTDGRCVFGHLTEGSTILVIIRPGQSGIPFDSYYAYYTFLHGKLQYVGDNTKGKYLLPTEKHVYYIRERSNVIAANVSQGKSYTIEPGFSDYDEKMNHYVNEIAVKCQQDTICSLTETDLDELYQQEATAAAAWLAALSYEDTHIIETRRSTTCNWGFIENEHRWAFMLAVGEMQTCAYKIYEGNERFGYQKVTAYEKAYSESLYYYTPQGEKRLFHTEGRDGYVNERRYSERKGTMLDLLGSAQLYKSDAESGCGDVHFPMQDGYFYTIQAVPLQSWVLSLPRIALIIIYSPEGKAILSGYFNIGSYFTICPLDADRYLLGVKDRRITLTYLIEMVGDYPPYTGPVISREDIIGDGLYLCEGGNLTKLKDNCANLRLQKLRQAKNWQKKIIRLE